jgi:hypothetical protein
MDLNFSEVSYDGDIEDAEAEQLRELVSQYEEAQSDNAAEFEAAKEKIEEVSDVQVSDFEDAREDLIETITDFDAFEGSPVSEDELDEATFSKLREWEAYFEEQATEDTDEEETDEDFSDFGTESKVPDDDEGDAELESVVGGVSGVNI